MSVNIRFSKFLDNLNLTDAQKADGAGKRVSVVRALNNYYWGVSDGIANSKYVGSWAKETRIRPPRDVDVLFELPWSVYTRFDTRIGNKQSQLLQEIRSVLSSAFYNTAIRGDGPVVVIPFTTYNIELVPTFAFSDGDHWVCMTDSGGHYKTERYSAEASAIFNSNVATKGQTRDLIRMMKRWQSHCSVPLKSFHIEILVIEFLAQWAYAGNSKSYYDWLCRDFFNYMVNRQNTFVYAPGTGEAMYLGSSWVSRAQTALVRAKSACVFESETLTFSAGEEWQKIFGIDIPKYLS